MEWLKQVAPYAKCKSDPLGQRGDHHARVIERMAARPWLPHPDSLTDRQCFIMVDAMMFHSSRVEAMKQAYRALYDDLTAPKTKEVEVWRVSFSTLTVDGRWVPSSEQRTQKIDADAEAAYRLKHGAKCVSVTGPHKQLVPAD